MTALRPDQQNVVVASHDADVGDMVADVLGRANFRCAQVAPDLLGLKLVADLKPNGIVLVGLNNGLREWVLNFAEGNPGNPTVIAIADPAILNEGLDWLYDVVSPTELGSALVHRLTRALCFSDMTRLSGQTGHNFGLSSAHLRRVSMIDTVTGLPNQRYFKTSLSESCAAAKRYQRPLSCLTVRIDNYAELETLHSAACRNDILDTFAGALRNIIREADTTARVDDDLFGFILPETSVAGAREMIQRLLVELEQCDYPHNAQVTVSSSLVELGKGHQDSGAFLAAVVSALPD